MVWYGMHRGGCFVAFIFIFIVPPLSFLGLVIPLIHVIILFILHELSVSIK